MKPHNMTLKDQITFLIVHKYKLLIGALLFGFLGILLHFLLPQTYTAVGYLYVSRSISIEGPVQGQTTPPDFTYEGYYARQNAVSYVPTVLGLLENDATSRAVLDMLDQPITTASIRKFGRSISVKKPAPQLIELTYKSSSPEFAQQAWKAIAKYTLERHYDLNSDMDPSISIKYLTEEPVVRESYRNPVLNFIIGSVMGAVSTVFFLAFKRHLSSPL